MVIFVIVDITILWIFMMFLLLLYKVCILYVRERSIVRMRFPPYSCACICGPQPMIYIERGKDFSKRISSGSDIIKCLSGLPCNIRASVAS